LIAEIIKKKTFSADSSAKVLTHYGYKHINEDTECLASQLKKIIGIKTLTINQTSLIEKAKSEYENVIYKSIVKSAEHKKSFVLIDEKNAVWSDSPQKYDITVFWPRTVYESGRPSWAS
jgi:hypothetical protein